MKTQFRSSDNTGVEDVTISGIQDPGQRQPVLPGSTWKDSGIFGSRFNKVFPGMTADNDSEIADLPQIEAWGTKVCFAHPYSSRERPLNELHNKFLPQFIPK